MLKDNWLTDKTTDFEYKKYVLLDYFSKIDESFNEFKLYPYFTNLDKQANQINSFLKARDNITSFFSKGIKAFNFKSKQIEYKRKLKDKSLQEIEKIIQFSRPYFKKHLTTGKELIKEAGRNISFE